MKFRRSFALIIVIVFMLGSVLSACSSSNNKQSKPANEPSSSANGTSQTPEQPATDDKTPIKLNWFVAFEWFKKDWNPNVNLMDKKLFEDLGIEVNFTSGSPEKLSAMIASGDIPDLVTMDNTAPQRGVLEKSNYVLPLDDLLTKYTPDFEVPKTAQDWFRADDGHYYGLSNFFYAPEQMKKENFYPTHNTMRARQDLLTSLNIDVSAFDTKEGTLEALRKVKAAKIKYNGFDIIPGYFFYDNLVQFFGAKREDAQGKYVDRFREPESLEAYQFMNQLYREGLMPEDSLTLTEPQVQEKVNAGSVFAYTGWRIKWSALESADTNAYFIPAGPIKGDAGNKFHFTPSTVSGWAMTMVGSKTKHEARIAKLIEYLSQDEMSIEMSYGPKGMAWDYDANGLVKFSQQRIDDFAADANAAGLKYGGIDWFMNWLPIQSAFPAPNTVFDKWESETEKHFSQYSYNTMPFEAIKPDGGTEIASIDIKIEEYRKSMGAKMVLAKSEAEVKQIFDEMAAQEEKLGYGRLFAYWDEHFQEAKKDLGIPFAWPENQK